jgi:hypothetical protein
MRNGIRRPGARIGAGLLASAVGLAAVALVGLYRSSSCGRATPSGAWAGIAFAGLVTALVGGAAATRRGAGFDRGCLVFAVVLGVLAAFVWSLLFYVTAGLGDSC